MDFFIDIELPLWKDKAIMRNLLHYTEIAEAMHRPPATVHRWLKGVRGISPDVAVDFERVTGIQAEAWIFPEKYGNPYLIETKDQKAA